MNRSGCCNLLPCAWLCINILVQPLATSTPTMRSYWVTYLSPSHCLLQQQFQDIEFPKFDLQIPVICGILIKTISKNIVWNLLHFSIGQHRKHGNSKNIPQWFYWRRSSTHQIYEMSSLLQLEPSKMNIQALPILRDILQGFKIECRVNIFISMYFAIFPLYVSKVFCLTRKNDNRSYQMLHLSQNDRNIDLMLQTATPLRKSASWPPNLPDEHSHTKYIFAYHLWMSHACHRFSKCCKAFTFCFLFARVQIALHLPRKATSERPKVDQVLNFLDFWFGKVFRATTACTFSTSQRPKQVRCWYLLYISTWKYISRQSGVHFCISYLAIWLRTRRFSEVTFRPSWAANHWKNE